MYNNSFDTNSYTTTTTPKQDALYPHSTLTPPFTLGSSVNITSPVIASTSNNVNITSPIIPPQLPPIQFNLLHSHILPVYNTDSHTLTGINHAPHTSHSGNGNSHEQQSNAADKRKDDRQPPVTVPTDDQLYTPQGSSAVWQIFKLYKADSSWAYCAAAVTTSIHGAVRRCGKWFIYHHPTTTNLKQHIYMQHKAMYDELYPPSTETHTDKSVERYRNGKIKRHNSGKKHKAEPTTISDIPSYDIKFSALHNDNAHNLLLQSQLNNVQCTDYSSLNSEQAINTLLHSNQFTQHMCNLLQRIMERTSPVVKQELAAINGQLLPHLVKLPFLDATAAATLKVKHIESCYNTRNTDDILQCYSEHTVYTHHGVYTGRQQLQQHLHALLQQCAEPSKFEFSLFSASCNHMTVHVTYGDKRVVQLLTCDEDGLIAETQVYDTT